MKREIRNTVLVLSGVCAAAGIIMCIAGFMNGGSILRAFQNIELMPEIEIKTSPRGTLPYGGGNTPKSGGSSGDYDDDIYDFFKEFGLDDDDIENFLNPYGGGSQKGSPGGGRIY